MYYVYCLVAVDSDIRHRVSKYINQLPVTVHKCYEYKDRTCFFMYSYLAKGGGGSGGGVPEEVV